MPAPARTPRLGEAEPLDLAQAADELEAPDAAERFSVLTGRGLLLLDLRRPDPGAAAALARCVPRLETLPCPSVALTGEPGAPAVISEIARAVDVQVAGMEELAAVLEGIRKAPLASLVLVQLLRGSEARSPAEGLLAESLAYATLQAGPEFAAWRRARPPRPGARHAAAPLLLEREGEELRLTLNRPERRNALDVALRDALVEAFELVCRDDSIERVVLSGAGPDFCSGGDLDEFGTLEDPARAHAVRSTRHPARGLVRCAARCEARLHGACVGAGVELAAFAARVVARRDARFQLPELSMGLVPGAGGSVSLPRRIGRQRSAWLALGGAFLDAPTAHAWGLVDELVD